MSIKECVKAGIGKEFLIVSMLRASKKAVCLVGSEAQKTIFPPDVRDQLYTKEEYFKKYGGSQY